MKTKSYECWDDNNASEDSAQIQNTTSPEDAVARFGRQFEIERDCDVWVRDPDNPDAEPQKHRLKVDPLYPFEYSV